jgi:DNA-binding transcriptional LysR family regulator
MNLNRIKLFRTVARYQSVTRTSGLLHVSQSSISHQLRQLQNDYGTKLYVRNGRGIELTPEGRRFLAEADPILQQTDRFEGRFKAHQQIESCESLLVGGSYGLAAGLLPMLLTGFQKSHTDVQLAVRAGNQKTIEQLIVAGEVEIALLVNTATPSLSLASELYRREPIVVFASRNHPLAKNVKISLSDLLQTPLVLRGEAGGSSPVNEKILREIQRDGRQAKIAAFCDSPDAVKVAVRRKVGVGLLYRDLVIRDAHRGDFKILKVEGLTIFGQSFIGYHSTRPLTRSAAQFLEYLRRRRQTGERKKVHRML